jgi:TetR/AcrR family tetracycline transcriptional repressor
MSTTAATSTPEPADALDPPVPPWSGVTKRRAKPLVKQPLTREAIVAAAMKVLDAEGLDAVSMRRVAQELDTGAASLYAHVANKDELLDLMLDQVMGEMRWPDPDPEHWQDKVRELMHEQRRVLGLHRDFARATLGRVPFGPNGLRGIEHVIALMRGVGLPPRVISWAADATSLLVSAAAYEDSIRASIWPNATDEQIHEYIQGMCEYMKNLPPDQFPNLVALAEPLLTGGTDERFAFAVDLMVRGLASYVEQPT